MENGKQVKCVPNTTINYNLDYQSLKKMIRLAIRLSPQDPLYVVEQIIFNCKNNGDIPIEESDIETAKTVIAHALSTSSILSGEAIVLTVHVTHPTADTNDEDQENVLSSNTRNPSPKRKYSPSKLRGRKTESEGGSQLLSPAARQPSPTMMKRPSSTGGSSPARLRTQTAGSPNRMRSLGSPNKTRPGSGIGLPSFKNLTSPLGNRNALPVTAPTRSEVKNKAPSSLSMDNIDLGISNQVDTNDIVINLEETQEEYQTQGIDDFEDEEEEEEELDDDIDDVDLLKIKRTWRDIPGDCSPLENLNRSNKLKLTKKKPLVVVSNSKKEVKREVSEKSSIINLAINLDKLVLSESTPLKEVIAEETTAELPESNEEVSEAVYLNESFEEDPSSQPNKIPFSSPNPSSVTSPKKNLLSSPESVKKMPPRKAATPMQKTREQDSSKNIEASTTIYSKGATLGEANSKFELSMRAYDNITTSSSSSSSSSKQTPSRIRRKASLVATPNKSSSKSSGSNNNNNDLSPIFATSAKDRPEGRPSTGTMERQWEFMKAHFVNNADDELEWLMVSKKKGAYSHAHRKASEAEDRYFKSLFDIDRIEHKIKLSKGASANIPKLVSEMSALNKLYTVNPKDEQCNLSMMALQEKLGAIVAVEENLSCFASKTASILRGFLDQNIEKVKISRKARELYVTLPAEFKSLDTALSSARLTSDEALDEIEKWNKREKEADEYSFFMRKEEQDWLNAEATNNMIALSIIRSFIPLNISDLSVNDLIESTKEQGGLLTTELALEIKNNKLLHWVITHRDEISYANFLAGDKKHFFENIEGLDIVEIRAIVLCIPEKFELDVDGKKSEWRNRLMTRAKQMVSQFNGDFVKGGWDSNLHKRAMVKLPPLKPEHERRSIYFYRTKEQCQLRLKQFDDKQTLLNKKLAWLTKAEKETEDAKKEYDTILNEMRDPDLKAQYGGDQFAKAKEMAKLDWKDADSKRKNLLRDVNSIKSSIASAPVTREQFLQSMDDLEAFLLLEGVTWSTDGQPPFPIAGVFDPSPEIIKVERQAAKFITAEEEAEQRRMEIAAINKSGKPNTNTANTVTDDNEDTENTNPESLTSASSFSLSAEAGATAGTDNGTGPAQSPASGSASSQFQQQNVQQGSGGVLTPRRNSVLNNINSDIANALNKMLKSPQGSNSSSSNNNPNPSNGRRVSTFNNTNMKDKDIATTASDAVVEKKEVRTTRSKLLQRMISSTAAAALRESSDEASTVASNASAGAGGALSFLDQIKARTNGSKLSLLGQIKSRAQPSSENIDPQELSEPLPPPRVAKMAPISFLDAIKSRRLE